MTVAENLAAAKLAHERYRTAHLTSANTDKLAQGAAIQQALTALLDADTADPAHNDPAWLAFAQGTSGVSARSLLEFYRDYLMPPEERQQKRPA